MFPTATKVLIVDDRMTIRKRVRKALSRHGLSNLVEASDTAQAWITAVEMLSIGAPFDLVVAGKSAIDLIARMRAHPDLNKSEFVLLASESERARLPDRVTLGLLGYLPKPASADFPSALHEILNHG